MRSRRPTSRSEAFWFTQRARAASASSTWAPEEAVARFREIIAPIAAEVGIDEPPDFFPAHTYNAA